MKLEKGKEVFSPIRLVIESKEELCALYILSLMTTKIFQQQASTSTFKKTFKKLPGLNDRAKKLSDLLYDELVERKY